MWYSNDMFIYMFEAEFVVLASLKSPVGFSSFCTVPAAFPMTFPNPTLSTTLSRFLFPFLLNPGSTGSSSLLGPVGVQSTCY